MVTLEPDETFDIGIVNLSSQECLLRAQKCPSRHHNLSVAPLMDMHESNEEEDVVY